MMLLGLAACQPLTGGPAKSKSSSITFNLLYEGGHRRDPQAHIVLHAESIPQPGQPPVVNSGYPINKMVTLPWEHVIYFEETIVVQATLITFVDLEPGESVSCFVNNKGDRLPRKMVVNISPETEASAQLTCSTNS